MNQLDFDQRNVRPQKRFRRLLALLACLLAANSALAQESSPLQYQVEAVFLFNFAKYVDWPAAAFTNATAPITIGVLGTDPFGGSLQHMVEGKSIAGRSFVIKHLATDGDLSGCQILFISDSEAARMGEILNKAAALPILTVGEDEAFAEDGGIINFVIKDGKVRLEIDLTKARKNGLTISSRLLAVADVVKGNTN
ncbi:MAG: YfiR family protein [Verrucomicrobiota bacterium]